MSDAVIRPFRPADQDQVVDLIIGIQRGEFGLAITLADQPDLTAIPDIYRCRGGNFWVAERDGTVVGTIGLIDAGDGLGVIRKMFVASADRGGRPSLAQGLVDALVAHARAENFRMLVLGTVERMHAALRFYARNGFTAVLPGALPAQFPRMPVDTHFFRLDL